MPEEAINGGQAREDEEIDLFEDEPYAEGFSWKTVWGALFVGFIMLPGSIYLGLVVGAALGAAAQWVTIIIFVEIAKRTFVRLKRQEIMILYGVAGSLVVIGGKLGTGAALFGGSFGSLIWDQYLVQSPQAEGFGIADKIPTWIVPARDSEALIGRNFLHMDWLIPIGIGISLMLVGRVCGLSMGYFLYRVTNDIEKLPFPLAPVYAGGATALAESSSRKETWRWRMFSIGAMIGVLYHTIYALIPIVTGAIFPKPLQLIPIPFIDLTGKVGTILPAARLGLICEPGLMLTGFVVPFWIIVGQFISAIGANLIMNPILHNFGMLTQWEQGMNLLPTRMANTLDFWLSVNIGFAWVVALIGIIGVISVWVRAQAKSGAAEDGDRRLIKAPPGQGNMHPLTALVIWAFTTSLLVILCHQLVPDFPIWVIIFFAFVYSPLLSYIRARLIGLTGSGTGVSFPFLREGTFLLFGRGVHIWFAPIPMSDYGAGAQSFKMLELTRTKFVSTVKATFASMVILLVCSFIFWSIIWKLGEIPSAAYPYVQKMWPYHATMQCLWVSSTLEEDADQKAKVIPEGAEWADLVNIKDKRKAKAHLLKAIRPSLMVYGGIAAALIYGYIWALKLPILLFYGLTTGIQMGPEAAIPMFIGALLNRYYLAPRIGPKRWKAYAPVLLAGYWCGAGLIGMAGCGIALISKAVTEVTF